LTSFSFWTRKGCGLQVHLEALEGPGDEGGDGFNIKRMGVGVVRRGVETQPGARDS